MITRKIRNFDLRQIAESGQCFRMNAAGTTKEPVSENIADYTYTVGCGAHFLEISQRGPSDADGSFVSFFCPESEFPFWENYFDLKTDYGAIAALIAPEDGYLRRAAAFGSGIRILRQDLWEMIITFIISQQKTIPNIKALVEALCERYGTRLARPYPAAGGTDGTTGEYFYAFPTPEQLARASLNDLLALKLGYRAKYIKRVCEDVCSGVFDLERLTKMDYPAAMEYLQRLFGIGEKVANCVCLFGLHHVDAFPIDTWIRKILLREYAPKSRVCAGLPQSKFCEALVLENFSRYTGCAGIMQQYIFYYERMQSRGKQA